MDISIRRRSPFGDRVDAKKMDGKLPQCGYMEHHGTNGKGTLDAVTALCSRFVFKNHGFVLQGTREFGHYYSIRLRDSASSGIFDSATPAPKRRPERLHEPTPTPLDGSAVEA